MYQVKSYIFAVLTAIGLSLSFPVGVFAEENAEFHVQTAYVREDGTMDVSVYLNGTDHLGGLDVELLYDPEKVSYVSSSIGETFTTTYGDVNHNEAEALIKYIVLYPTSQDADGALLKATFTLKSDDSYQPRLNVVDVVDDSDEIRDIPYTVSYQQADGSWSETQDTSGEKADVGAVEEALSAYGAAEDIEAANTEYGMNVSFEERGSSGASDESAETDDGTANENEASSGPIGTAASDDTAAPGQADAQTDIETLERGSAQTDEPTGTETQGQNKEPSNTEVSDTDKADEAIDTEDIDTEEPTKENASDSDETAEMDEAPEEEELQVATDIVGTQKKSENNIYMVVLIGIVAAAAAIWIVRKIRRNKRGKN